MNFFRVKLPEKVMKVASMDEWYDDSLSFAYNAMFSPQTERGEGGLIAGMGVGVVCEGDTRFKYRYVDIVCILVQETNWCRHRNNHILIHYIDCKHLLYTENFGAFSFPPTFFKMLFLQIIILTKRLEYKPESFIFKCIYRVTVYNWDTNFVHTSFPILQNVWGEGKSQYFFTNKMYLRFCGGRGGWHGCIKNNLF